MTTLPDDRPSGVVPRRLPLDAVVTHHLDGFRSGVARFNEILATQLDLPLVGLGELQGAAITCPLLSFKVRELPMQERGQIELLVDDARWPWEIFLHDFGDLPLERRLVSGAQRVHCGNHEIEHEVAALNPEHATLWTPGLLLDDRQFRPAELSVFSFGMAHKIQTQIFKRLRAILDQSGQSYAVYVSAANHETASIGDAEAVFAEMHEIFPAELYFLGNLSDVAVANHLSAATYFAAFFSGGVRANNTTVASAMERGAVVVTNLDVHSPPEFVHMDNVIDIERCEELPLDPLVLRRISVRAMETARARGWQSLVKLLR